MAMDSHMVRHAIVTLSLTYILDLFPKRAPGRLRKAASYHFRQTSKLLSEGLDRLRGYRTRGSKEALEVLITIVLLMHNEVRSDFRVEHPRKITDQERRW